MSILSFSIWVLVLIGLGCAGLTINWRGMIAALAIIVPFWGAVCWGLS